MQKFNNKKKDMKRFLLLLLVCLCNTLVIKSNNACSDYFYPQGKIYIYTNPSTGMGTAFQVIQKGDTSYLQKASFYKENLLSVSKFNFNKDTISIVLSTEQLYVNASLSESHQDSLVLFALPNDNGCRTWRENDRGTIAECSSEYTYIRFYATCHRVVKITKKSKVKIDDGSMNEIVEWSYWEEGRGKLARFLSINSSEPTLMEVLEGWGTSIKEITKQEYEDYLLSEYYKKMHPLSLEDFLYYDEWKAIQLRITDVAVNYIPVTKSFKDYYYQSWYSQYLGGRCKIEILSLDNIKITLDQNCFKEGLEDTIRAILIEELKGVKIQTAINPITNQKEYRKLTCDLSLKFRVQTGEYNAFYEKELDNWSIYPKEFNRSASSLPQLKMKFNHVIKEYCVRKKKTPKSLSFKAIVIESFNQSKESYVFMTDLK